MRLAGQTVKKCNRHTIVIPRSDGEAIILIAQAILDSSLFEKLCPQPTPPVMMKAGGQKIANLDDPRFKLATESYGKKRLAWIVLESLRLGTPGLEWDSVDLGDPNTWEKYQDELKEAGFTWSEIALIIQGCMIANSLDESKLEEARASFLSSQAATAAAQSSSPQDDPSDTPSGALASA